MSAAISRKKGWEGAHFDVRLDAHKGNHLVFPIPAAIPSGAALLLQKH
jgi:hypothetical protein